MVDDKGISTVEVVEFTGQENTLTDGSTSPVEQERRLVRRLDMRLMPVLCALYLFACEYPRSASARCGIDLARLQTWIGSTWGMPGCKDYLRTSYTETQLASYSTG